MASWEVSMPTPRIPNSFARYIRFRPLPHPRSSASVVTFRNFLPCSRRSQRVNLIKSSDGSSERVRWVGFLYWVSQKPFRFGILKLYPVYRYLYTTVVWTLL